MVDETLTVEEHTKAHSGKVTGYKQLTQEEINTINLIKQKGNEVRDLIDSLPEIPGIDIDGRWGAMATTTLQNGFMQLVRSVAKPDFF